MSLRAILRPDSYYLFTEGFDATEPEGSECAIEQIKQFAMKAFRFGSMLISGPSISPGWSQSLR